MYIPNNFVLDNSIYRAKLQLCANIKRLEIAFNI